MIMVACGNLDHQIPSSNISSPTITFAYLFTCLSIGIQRQNAEILCLDIDQTANLNPKDGEYFITIPACINQKPGFARKVSKALYGLKQSAWLFHQHVATILIKIGFQQSQIHPCIFYEADSNGCWKNDGLLVAVFVDDLTVIGPSTHTF